MKAKTFVNHILQEAEPLDWNSTVAPNAAYENVLSMLNALPRNEEGLLFGFLADIEPDPLCGLSLGVPKWHHLERCRSGRPRSITHEKQQA